MPLVKYYALLEAFIKVFAEHKPGRYWLMEDIKVMHFGKELVYFLKIFGDKCHHGKEENYLFKELEKQRIPNEGGSIGVMLQEHQEGRMYIDLMSKSVKID